MQALIDCLNSEVVDWANFEKLLRDFDKKKSIGYNNELVPSRRQILGWYVPDLRALARSVRADKVLAIIDSMPQNYHEESVILALLLGRIKSVEVLMPRLERFISTIDNWATCDILCGELKIVDRCLPTFWNSVNVWINNCAEYMERFAIVLMMKYYINGGYIDRVLLTAKGRISRHYYVNMALAWLYAEACVRFGDKVLATLRKYKINKDVIKFTKEKVRDSYRVPKEIKQAIMDL